MKTVNSASKYEDITRVLSEVDATPIRTRGRLPVGRMAKGGKVMSFESLITSLRQAVTGFPLTFIVHHDWETRQINKFISELQSLLDNRDGLWVVSDRRRRERGEILSGVELDLKDNTDKRLYETLVGDIVIFIGQATQVDQIKAWQHRARVIIVDKGASHFDEIVKQAKALELETYERVSGNHMLEL